MIPAATVQISRVKSYKTYAKYARSGNTLSVQEADCSAKIKLSNVYASENRQVAADLTNRLSSNPRYL